MFLVPNTAPAPYWGFMQFNKPKCRCNGIVCQKLDDTLTLTSEDTGSDPNIGHIVCLPCGKPLRWDDASKFLSLFLVIFLSFHLYLGTSPPSNGAYNFLSKIKVSNGGKEHLSSLPIQLQSESKYNMDGDYVTAMGSQFPSL